MYITRKKELYNNLINYIEEEEDNYSLTDLIRLIDSYKYEKDRDEFEQFLQLINDIANNHHRKTSLFEKIITIIQHYKDTIKSFFSNLEIFNIFRSNKMLLLLLFENGIIIVDNDVYNELFAIIEKNRNRYCHFFYPELKKFVGEEKTKYIENELLSINPYILLNFDEKRHIGENDSYICTIIRNDLVEEFVSFITQSNISLTSQIETSIFETNSCLIEYKNPTLIEYSAFCGSIKIFKYLRINNVELKPSLWFYTIHSHNAELIHILEENQVKPFKKKINKSYENFFLESIKCHHNDISDYIENNLLDENFFVLNYSAFITHVIKYHNYKYFPSNFKGGNEFFDLCFYNYNKLMNLYMEQNENDIKEVTYNLIPDNFINNLQLDETVYEPDNLFYLFSKEDKVPLKCFQRNYNLKKIAIPSSVVSIGNYAFSNCNKLTEVSIASSVTSIGKHAFDLCSSLVKIKIPSSVISIGESAFCGCSLLKEITIPSSVTSIGKVAFAYCSSLTFVTILAQIENIEDYTFCGCTSLKRISIPPSVKTIGEFSFYRCSSLVQVFIPSSLSSIKEKAFKECTALTQLTVQSSPIGNESLKECASIKKMAIPSSMSLIEDSTFDLYKLLSKIKIHSSEYKIGENAFEGCSSLTSVSIPFSTSEICHNAFYDCISLKEISCLSPTVSIED